MARKRKTPVRRRSVRSTGMKDSMQYGAIGLLYSVVKKNFDIPGKGFFLPMGLWAAGHFANMPMMKHAAAFELGKQLSESSGFGILGGADSELDELENRAEFLSGDNLGSVGQTDENIRDQFR